MIKVSFELTKNIDPYDSLYAGAAVMPWLKYLVDNSIDLQVETNNIPQAHESRVEVIYKFDLPPKKETLYRMKFR